MSNKKEQHSIATLRQRLSQIPDQLSAIDRKMKTVKDPEKIRDLIEQRAKIQEEAEVISLQIPHAQIAETRAEAASIRVEEQKLREQLPALIEGDKKAQADLAIAQRAATIAAKALGKVEPRVKDLAAAALKLEARADVEEARLNN